MWKFKNILFIIISFHFLLIIIGQLGELGYLNNTLSKNIKNKYIVPFFEQNWGMFAPNPPRGNQYFIISYKTNTDSITLDIHEKIRQGSILSIFNINQRILKYQNECYNDIIKKLNNKKLDLSKIEKNKSHGLESILNYSKLVLIKQKEYIEKLASTDSIKVNIYLVNESLNNINTFYKYNKKEYMVLKNIYLTRKSDL